MKKNTPFWLLAVVIMSIAFSRSSEAALLSWGTSTGRLYDSLGTTILDGDRNTTGQTTTGFIQLIYLGANGSYDGFTAAGTGVLGDDLVVQTAWVGKGAPALGGSPDGYVSESLNHSYAIGSGFVIRFFDTPTANYASGDVPTTGNYGVYDPGFTTQSPVADTLAITSNQNAWQAVPEPGTVTLMVVGVASLSISSLRRRKNRA